MALSRRALADLRGGVRLLVDGTRHVTGVVEAVHGQVQRLAPPLQRAGAGPQPATRGLTGLVYRSIQGGAQLVGGGLDGLLAPLAPLLAPTDAPSPRRDTLVAALNGVLGDHLQRSGNALALPFQLRHGGRLLDAAALGADAPGRVLVLVHGLCMGEHGWAHGGHDHGQALAAALGAAPVYASYNSGLHISDNGLALSAALQALADSWPVPLQRLDILGHSMGGLVARSALAQAAVAGHTWPVRLKALVFLGTPHHGAALERSGNLLQTALGWSPYLLPFTRLTRVRSAGITDLRHGNLLAADWQGASRHQAGDRRTPVPLPAGVNAYAIASISAGPGQRGSRVGDGLVTGDSALGRHRRPAMRLKLPASHTWVGEGIGHLALLGNGSVYRRLLGWLRA